MVYAGSPCDLPEFSLTKEEIEKVLKKSSHEESRRIAPINGIEMDQDTIPLMDQDFTIDIDEEEDLVEEQITSNSHTHSLSTLTVKKNGLKRYCKTCLVWKPDRTHHCRVCERCVLKMDHHCPWISPINCVGFYNYKYFFCFIFHASLFASFIAITTIPPLLIYVELPSTSIEISLDAIEWGLLVVAGCLFGVILLSFSIYHFNMIMNNRTTIESLERGNFYDERIGGLLGLRDYQSSRIKKVNVFNMGKMANIKQVLGLHWWLWFIPLRNHTSGDGTKYPIKSVYRIEED